MTERDSPGVVVPPPLIFIGTLIGGLVLDRFVVSSTTAVAGDNRRPKDDLTPFTGAGHSQS
jgi:hypothetical protein